jgi:uncharacterized protein YeaO (DUF488 family)
MARDHHTATILPQISLRRAYEPPVPVDGRRILVDRLWPRGLTKNEAKVDDWYKEVAPSNELRRWFGHVPAKWTEFQRRYREELERHPEYLTPLLDAATRGPISLIYSAKDEQHNQAVVLKEVMLERLQSVSETEDQDIVSEASNESFPASDAPSWAIGQDHEQRRRVSTSPVANEKEE